MLLWNNKECEKKVNNLQNLQNYIVVWIVRSEYANSHLSEYANCHHVLSPLHTDGKKQKTRNRKQKTKQTRQKTENAKQKTKNRKQTPHMADRKQKTFVSRNKHVCFAKQMFSVFCFCHPHTDARKHETSEKHVFCFLPSVCGGLKYPNAAAWICKLISGLNIHISIGSEYANCHRFEYSIATRSKYANCHQVWICK